MHLYILDSKTGGLQQRHLISELQNPIHIGGFPLHVVWDVDDSLVGIDYTRSELVRVNLSPFETTKIHSLEMLQKPLPGGWGRWRLQENFFVSEDGVTVVFWGQKTLANAPAGALLSQTPTLDFFQLVSIRRDATLETRPGTSIAGTRLSRPELLLGGELGFVTLGFGCGASGVGALVLGLSDLKPVKALVIPSPYQYPASKDPRQELFSISIDGSKVIWRERTLKPIAANEKERFGRIVVANLMID